MVFVVGGGVVVVGVRMTLRMGHRGRARMWEARFGVEVLAAVLWLRWRTRGSVGLVAVVRVLVIVVVAWRGARMWVSPGMGRLWWLMCSP